MSMDVGRHTWLNTFVGVLDSAFGLTEEELFATTEVVKVLLDILDIPRRGPARELPVAVALEASASLYSVQISSSRTAAAHHVARAAGSGDLTVTLEAWRQALLSMLTTAYALDPFEVLEATRIIDELLLSLGLPARASKFLPDDVVRAHCDGA